MLTHVLKKCKVVVNSHILHSERIRTAYSYVSKNRLVKMKDSELLNPPDCVRGMTELLTDYFNKEIEIPVMHVKNVKLSDIIGSFKKYFLKIDNFKPVKHMENSEAVIYLNPYTLDHENLSEDIENSLKKFGLSKDNICLQKVMLSYSNYTADQIFKAILPTDKEGMASFTKVGHILHVNLREHLLPYKSIIGKVLLDKTPGCRTVVNKTNMIDNTYRNFQMEILQGDEDMMVSLKENTCTFEFDFSSVYWNSRLSTEHERIVKILKENDVLFDVFAGVGPFSVPAAKNKCIVFANDLNPESYKWLNHNFSINKIKSDKFKTYNKDGRDFIINELKKNLPQYLSSHNVYITMNLPAMAVEFLNSFVGLLKEDDIPEKFKPPTIFVYCFAKGEDFSKIAKDLVISNLGCDRITDIFKVRTVSSLKEMMRVTITLDKDILIGNTVTRNKRKIEDDCLKTKKCK